MKNLWLIIALSFSGLSVQALGNIQGHCSVSSNQFSGARDYRFNVKPGEEVQLGILVGAVGEKETAYTVYSVGVINNMGTAEQNIFGGFILALSRPPGDYIFQNPPVLCPSTPKADRDQCEADNNKTINALVAATDAFHPAKGNSHAVTDYAMPHIVESSVAPGYKTVLQYDLGAAQVSCEAAYN